MPFKTTQVLKKADFDIDKHLNPYIPAPRPHKLPSLVNRFLGYHPPRTPPVPDVLRAAWVLVSTFAGVVLVMVTLKYGAPFKSRGSPVFIPSWAASAILIYNVIESPLGQPRNTFFGNLLSSFVGICITKLFMLNTNDEKYLWVCGALCVAVASISMSVTKTLHPPGGASALLCAIDDQVRELGWFYLVIQIVSGLIMLSVACLFNNVQRKYPLYWWTPNTLQASGRVPTSTDGVESGSSEKSTSPNSSPDTSTTTAAATNTTSDKLTRMQSLERVLSDRHFIGASETGDLKASDVEAAVTKGSNYGRNEAENMVVILPTHYALPEGLELTGEEEALLVNIQDQLKAIEDAEQAKSAEERV